MRTKRVAPPLLALISFAALLACSDDSAPHFTPDARVDSVAIDTTPATDGAATTDTRGGDLFADLGEGDAGFTTCAGACAVQSVTIAFGGQAVALETATYGIDRDAQGNPGVYLEAYHAAAAGCPTESSPTPAQTLIISGLPLPSYGASITKDDGLVVSLIDFEGDLLGGGLVSKADSASVTFVAAQTCPSCVGMPAPSHPEGFVALELTASFAEGAISGHVYAPHCDSLDL